MVVPYRQCKHAREAQQCATAHKHEKPLTHAIAFTVQAIRVNKNRTETPQSLSLI